MFYSSSSNSFAVNGLSMINNLHSRIDDGSEGDMSSTDDLKGTFIPNGPYPPIMEGTLFHFPYPTLSHLFMFILLQTTTTQ